MLEGLQVTFTEMMVDDCDALEFWVNVPPVHPVSHNTPEKIRQSAALRSIIGPPFYLEASSLIFP
jgi:hypothetical protein